MVIIYSQSSLKDWYHWELAKKVKTKHWEKYNIIILPTFPKGVKDVLVIWVDHVPFSMKSPIVARSATSGSQ